MVFQKQYMSLQKFPVKKTTLFELPVINVNSERFKFSDNEKMLDNMFVTGIIIGSAAIGTTPEGKTIVPDAIQKKAFLTLVNKKTGQEEIKKLPLETLINSQTWVMELDAFPIDVSKSYITLYDRTGLLTTHAFLITFLYQDQPNK